MTMERGAFALIDCLGFKKAGDNPKTAEAIVSFFEQTKARTPTSAAYAAFKPLLPDTRQYIGFISDTIAVSSVVRDLPIGKENADGYAVLLTVQACIELIKAFAEGPVPLSLRGHVALGSHIARDSFFIGPAVTEAADRSGLAQGAYVTLSPECSKAFSGYMEWCSGTLPKLMDALGSAAAVDYVDRQRKAVDAFTNEPNTKFGPLSDEWWGKMSTPQRELAAPIFVRHSVRNQRNDFIIRGYPVAIKNGTTQYTDVINPLFLVAREDRANTILRLLSNFDTSIPDVRLKHENTRRLLWTAEEFSREVAARSDRADAVMEAELEKTTGLPIPRPVLPDFKLDLSLIKPK